MKSENSISSLLTPESKIQRPVAPVIKVVLNVWSKDSSDKNEYEPTKQFVFSNVKDAIESKDISSDLIDYTAYEIYINGNFVESGKYKDLKKQHNKRLYRFRNSFR